MTTQDIALVVVPVVIGFLPWLLDRSGVPVPEWVISLGGLAVIVGLGFGLWVGLDLIPLGKWGATTIDRAALIRVGVAVTLVVASALWWTLSRRISQVAGALARLQPDNASQERKVREAWEVRAATYKLVKAPGGALVWQYIHPAVEWASERVPDHYACPNCFTKRQIQILQAIRNSEAACPGCKLRYVVRAL